MRVILTSRQSWSETLKQTPAVHTPLPLSLEEITPEWLSEALSSMFPGVRVASCQRTGAGHRGTSTSHSFALEYADRNNHADLPDDVYIKGGFHEVMRHRVWAALIQEARFYSELAHQIPANIPRCYFAGIDETAKQGVLLLEDIAKRGARFASVMVPVPVDAMAANLELQALFHAKFWRSPVLEKYRQWQEPQKIFLKWVLRESNWEVLKSRKYAELIPKILPSRELALRALDRLWQLNDQQPQTLIHGDCHGGNLFFESDGRAGFVDFQCTCTGAAIEDVSYSIVTSLDTEARRGNERHLLQHYLGALRAAGVDAPGFDEFFLAYRENMMRAFGLYVTAPLDQQAEEKTNVAAFRILHAAIDLDGISALGLH